MGNGLSHAPSSAVYAELQAISNFSFLEGGSHPDELVAQAKALGLAALGIADRNTVAGVVRAHLAARQMGLRLLPGARLELLCGLRFVCYPTDRAAWGRLCRLLSFGQIEAKAPKGECHISLDDVARHAEGQVLIVLPPQDWDWREMLAPHEARIIAFGPGTPARACAQETSFEARLLDIKDKLAPAACLYLAAAHTYRGDDRARLAALDTLARRTGVPLLATGDVIYHTPHRRPLQDVLTAIRNHTTVAEAGLLLARNAERHLKSPREMMRLMAGYEQAVARTIEVVEMCRFSLDELRYEYPDEPVPPGFTPQEYLERLVREGARHRFPKGVPDQVAAQLERELEIIAKKQYAPYFLTVHDIVAFANSKDILCQGRGSAANSLVCYCLGITGVSPDEANLLFERFISSEREEPPDIDVDFEHERREEVIQHIYARYGRERAGLAATVISYRARSAVREVGKAMGLAEDTLSALAGMVWGTRSSGALPEPHIREAGLDPKDPLLARVIELAGELSGFPRHLSQHVGGFVLSRVPLVEVVPIGNAAMENRTFIEWDKDDLATLGLLKVDVLALGMLTCIRKAFDLIAEHEGERLTLATVPREDSAVYDMLCNADSLGVFQVESRAQMNMLPRLKPRCFYDLVIEVAIVRPGPIQGDMVHPYLRRREGVEKVVYPSPKGGDKDELRRILDKTLGVPLFQEQAMRIAMEAARFSDADVNELRKAMATFRRRGTIGRLEEKMISAMVARGYERDFAQRCFNQIKGFGEYGFPESHAASFALLVYASAWLKVHHPAAFACALLNSQPMGFYSTSSIVRDAQAHGVRVLPIDIAHSHVDSTLEGGALRLGLREIKGLDRATAARIVEARELAPFSDMADLVHRASVRQDQLDVLAEAGALASLVGERRQAIWQARSPRVDGLFAGIEADEPKVELSPMPRLGQLALDYARSGLSLDDHPLCHLRDELAKEGVVVAEELASKMHGAAVKVAGVVLIRQRPATASGVVFLSIEDETGIVNLIVRPKIFEAFESIVRHASIVFAQGTIERTPRGPVRDPDQVPVIHVLVTELRQLEIPGLTTRSRDWG